MKTFKHLQPGDTVYKLTISSGGHRGTITEHTVTFLYPEFISIEGIHLKLNDQNDPTFSISPHRQKSRKPSGELVIYSPSYDVITFYLKNYFIPHISLLLDKRKSEGSVIKQYI